MIHYCMDILLFLERLSEKKPVLLVFFAGAFLLVQGASGLGKEEYSMALIVMGIVLVSFSLAKMNGK